MGKDLEGSRVSGFGLNTELLLITVICWTYKTESIGAIWNLVVYSTLTFLMLSFRLVFKSSTGVSFCYLRNL